MNLVEFLQTLVIKGWKLWCEGGELYYDSPGEQSTSSVLVQLRQHQAEIIGLLRDRPDIFKVHPLSDGQKALWFVWQLAPESSAYNVVFTSRICDDVNVTNLQLAVAKLLDRHPSLRSTFPKLGSEPIQQVHEGKKADFQQIDATTMSETELYSSVCQESQRPFDLEQESVIRVRLFTCSQKEHVLLLRIHQIAIDGWSLDIILSELPKLYREQQQGILASLPTLKHSYSDYVHWQKKILEGPEGEKLWSYWQDQLKGELPELNLPTDKPRPPIQTYNGASHNFQLSDQLTQQLNSLAIKSDATLYVTLLAAFEVLLYRYTRQEDILVGSPIADRLQSEFRGIVGYFVNPVVLRGDLSNNPSFQEFLTQIRQRVLEAVTHQDYPFDLLVEKLQPNRDPSRSPIFQAFFVLQQFRKSRDIQKLFINDIKKDVDWGGLKLRPFEIPQQEGQFDLSLEIFEASSSVFGIFKYNRDLFDGSTIERMAGHFQNLLSAIVENPVAAVGELPLLSAAERHQLLVEWNTTESEYPQDKCIHQLFESQVQKTPQSVAVVFENQQLTYLELNQRANQLAHHLQSLGVEPEVLVGICVERSVEMVVGLLGILKAGGAYVPLDPAYPQERLSFMLEDAEVAVLLSEQRLVEKLPEHQGPLVCLDTDWQLISQSPQDNPVTAVQGTNLAYVIYTSGSTGQPKGVAMNQLPLCNLIWCHLQNPTISGGAKTLQFAPLSFDVSFQEIFSTWCSGGTLVLITEELRRDASCLLGLVEEKTVERLFLPFVGLQQLAEVSAGRKSVTSSLREIITAGEQLQITPAIANWFRKLSGCTLHNHYGPSESHVVTTFTLTNSVDSWSVLPPIGRPISNTTIYILDEYLQPVPIGVPGELYIGGDGLARGYLNRSELTSEKFIPNPFSDFKSERLYKTGDLARYLADGNIEYLGRIDNQVKIRGFRIELGEIEAVLNTHTQIQQAVVIARVDIPGNKCLIAYVVPCDASLTTNQLREFLRQQLPEYMVPSVFVTLDTLPLTPNGKIDRKALPKPDGDITREHEYIAPRTPNEEIIANIFTGVLGVQNVGIHDNFFTLGGHSLLATQLISRLRLAFSVEISIRAVFESPTVTQLDLTITQLRTQERGLTLPPIQPIEGDTELLPLSWAQQRLWFLNQLSGSSATYNIPVAVRMTGNLDLKTLQQALSEIVRRHSVLRTSFPTVNGTPRQVIHPEATMNINVVDLQQSLALEGETVLQQQVLEEAITPFNLENAPLIRCSVLHLSSTEYVLLLTMHHIVSDGWSMGVLIQELSALYQAFCAGVPSPLPELPIQYADFAVWQRQWVSGVILETQLNYWISQLHGAPELLQLPTDRPRPVVQTYRGRTQSFTLNRDLTQKLQTLSRESGTTLFMTLLAAFATLLYRYSGESDIVIGSPIANRNRSEIESLIGFFVNTLVLRTRFEDEPSFEKLLLQVRETTLKAYENQDVPFEQVVEALEPQRSLSHSPLFGVMFVWQNTPMSELELPGVTWCHLDGSSTVAKLDLTVLMSETSQGLVGEWEYNTDLFDRSTIERMVGHFQNLLSAIVENPVARVDELPLLNEAERHQLLVEWNDTESVYPTDKCIHQLFEEQVQKTPQSVAVVFFNQQLTYLELNQRANQLAHHLQTLGVGPEVLVGICVQRSVEMVVGILGILKAGGAYVPIDPEYPQERLSFMLEDAEVAVLLSEQRLVERLPEHQGPLVCLDTDWQLIAQSPQDNPITAVQGTNLAYVIYTSGSTGQPKGVAMNQLPLCNLIWCHLQNPTISGGAKTLQFAPLSFDVSFQEIFSTWCSGGTLVLITEELRRDASCLLGLVEEKTVERLFLPFVGLQQLAEVSAGSKSVISSLREIITAGEQLQITPAIANWLRKLSGCTLHNHYGPSESHVVTTFTLTNSVDSWPVLPPIGRPISNTTIYILDEYLQPVPIGVPGELYIGGDGLARGYLNRSELTQEKFIPNPFSNYPGSRLYKTGDQARYLPDGNIEYLGRIDNQVKIRGFRIELGEIEGVLSQNVDVQASCVIAREDTPGEKRLVAYVVPHQHCTPPISELRHFLKAKLPEYMVPNAFVMLESLPLTPNGKVDRRALRTPDLHSELKDKYVAPRIPVEEMLAQIWTQVLKVEQVGIHDNFFELGGHSLLATQLVSRIRNIFKLELPLRELFAIPTVAELALSIQQLQQQNLELTSPPILPRARDAELPLSFAQNRLWFLDQFQPNSASYNIPIALRLVGSLEVAALEQSLQEIIHRHEALRTNFITVDGQPTQIIQTETNWTVSVFDLKHLPTLEQEIASQQLAQQQATQPFDLSSSALLRATLVMLSETEHILNVCMHHIVSDGWSMGVFVQELAALYNAYSQSQPSGATTFAPLPIQYADFALWQRQWLQGDVLQSQLSYWQQQLADAPALLVLPTDRPRPGVQTFAGAYQEFALSVDLTGRLTKLSQEQRVTLFMTLLAAFDTLLYRYTGQSDILVGTPIANRNRQEIEGLIGFFVNTLVLRIDLSANPSFSELLNRVREVSLGAYAHQDLPFEMLVEALQPQRNLSHTPLFQVIFALQNAPMSVVELTGLTVSQLQVETKTTKFDLTLSMKNTATGLVGVWEYNTDLFDPSTIERMTGHFVTVLSAIVANPQQHLAQLPLLTEVEQQQLLVEWNNTQADYPQDKCIHQLFEEQVERTPDAVAIVYENQQLTYHQLNCRANQLAHYLKSMGVGTEMLVGLCVERSLLMVVGILGILKAGGAYVPIDPDYPQGRFSFILEDTQVKVLLIQQQLVESVPKHQARIVCLDTDWQTINQANQNNLNSKVNYENLSYVIYTSGSTGTPKGVAVTHQAVNRLVKNTNYIQLTPDDHVAQAANIAFDAATFEIWGALLHGSKLIGIPQNILLSPHDFTKYIREQKISVLFLTTALFNQLASNVPQAFQDLRYLLFGGEAVDPKWVKEVLNKGCPQQLLHVYGPTESTTFCSWYLVQDVTQEGTTIPIGRPISNTQIYLLDQNLQLVPIGVGGEIYIGGDGLARGYLNLPDLTKQKFIPNPFLGSREEPLRCGGSLRCSKWRWGVGSGELENHNQQPTPNNLHYCSAYLYKTGDLARYLPDGNIEFLGRLDHQVKIRGFRIELGEIEAVLAQHPGVQETVVIAHEYSPGDKRLVAYIVPQPEVSATTEDLRHFLKQKLPNYMYPSVFVLLSTLPLTPNGKVDRSALLVPDQANSSGKLFVAPRTMTEEMLARIWTEILNINSFTRGSSDINIYDNFFDLGGHSLVATLLVTRIRQVFQVDLPLWRLFDAPTIAGLAESIETERQTNILKHQIEPKPWSSLVPIQLGGSKRPFFLVTGGENGSEIELITYAKLVYFLGQEQPVYGLKARGSDPTQQPHTQVEVMASDYIKEIRTIQPCGPYLIGGECIGGVVAFEMAKQLVELGEKVGLLVLIDTQFPSHTQQIGYFLKRIIFKLQILRRIPHHLTKLLQLNSRELLSYTFDKVQKANNVFVEQKYVTVVKGYKPRPYIGRITLLVNEDYYQKNPAIGWDHVAAGGLEIHQVPGDHDSYLGKYVKTTSDVLKGCLDAAQREI